MTFQHHLKSIEFETYETINIIEATDYYIIYFLFFTKKKKMSKKS